MLDVNFALSWNYQGKRGTETLFHTAVGNTISALRDWSPAFQEMVTEILQPAVQEQFDTAGQGEWAELAPSTLARKAHNGAVMGVNFILFETGRLEQSFREGGQDNVTEISRDRLIWGSRVGYGVFHQTGTGSGFQQTRKGTGRGMPMRKILVLSEARKRAMRSILVRRLATIARREGFAVGGSGQDPLAARQLGESLLGV